MHVVWLVTGLRTPPFLAGSLPPHPLPLLTVFHEFPLGHSVLAFPVFTVAGEGAGGGLVLCAAPFFPGSPVWTNSRSLCARDKSGNSFKRASGDLARPPGHRCPYLVTVLTSSKSPLFSQDQALCVEEKGLVLLLLTSEHFERHHCSAGSLGREGGDCLNPVQAPHSA